MKLVLGLIRNMVKYYETRSTNHCCVFSSRETYIIYNKRFIEEK